MAVGAAITAHAAEGEILQERTLDDICRIVRRDFYDAGYNGVDWDGQCPRLKPQAGALSAARFDARMSELAASLATSHTAYLPADDWRLAMLHDVFEKQPDAERLRTLNGGTPKLRGAGYFTRTVGDKTFVDLVLSGSPADDAGLLAGDEIVDADGSQFATVWLPQDSAQADTAHVKIRREEAGAVAVISMAVKQERGLQWLGSATRASVRVVERRGFRIGYLRGWTMLTRSGFGGPADEIARALSDGTFAGVDAVVFDARGLIGGGGLDVLAEWLMPRPRIRMRERGSQNWHENAGLAPETPLVVLVDQNTRSSAEIFARITQMRKIAPLVGSRTAGAVAGGSLRALANGAGLYVAVALLEVNGEVLEGRGVTPDVAVERPLAYAKGADPQFDAALDEAMRLTGKPARPR